MRETLAVGLFPYLLKLLLAHSPELRVVLLYLWARIVMYAPSCTAYIPIYYTILYYYSEY